VPRELYGDFLPYFLRTLNDAFDLETHRFQNLMLIRQATTFTTNNAFSVMVPCLATGDLTYKLVPCKLYRAS
jgi:hypothetical protein